MCVLVRVRCCSKRYTVTLGKPPYRCLAFLACNGSIANRYSVYRKTPYGRLIGAVTVRNGKRYAGQLPAVEPIVGLGDVAGVEQLVDPETGEFDADVVETGQSKSQLDRRKQLVAVIEEKGAPTADGLTNVLDMDLERYSGRSYPGFRTLRMLLHQC